MSELVNHPSHYNKSGRKECIEEMLEKYGKTATASFCLLNAYKYLYRAGDKDNNSEEQDRNKAKWYFNFVKTRLYSAVRSGSMVQLYCELKKEFKNDKG